MDHIFTSCEHCAERFEAPGRSAGGLTNCPSCGKATTVPGGRDDLWTLIVAGGVLATVVLVVCAYLSGGLIVGGLTLSGCAIAAVVFRLSS